MIPGVNAHAQLDPLGGKQTRFLASHRRPRVQARLTEHSPDRVDTRAGHYERQFQTQAGEVTLKMPKLRSLPTQIKCAKLDGHYP